jgi:hypothetical protein
MKKFFFELLKDVRESWLRFRKRCTITGCTRPYVYDLGRNQDKVCREHL